MIVALAAAAFLAAHWATGLQDVWARGMLTFDTLWYHGPFAAKIAETGSVWPLHFTDPLYLNWFYPQNSELLHGAGIALFDRDLFSPLINFGWLGICLLAAWCIGRPYGVAPLSVVAVALVIDIGPMVPREAGTPANDVAPVAMLLAAAAVLVNAAAQARAGSPGRADVSLRGPAAARPAADGRAARRRARDGPRPGDEADDRRRRRGDGGRPALDHAGGCASQGAALLPRRGRRHGRVLVPAQPDPLGQPAAVGPGARADRPARPRQRARGPRQLQRRPLHLPDARQRRLELVLLQGDHQPLRAAVVRVLRRGGGGGGAGHRAAAHPCNPAARRGHPGRRDRLPVHAADRRGAAGSAPRLRDQPALPGARDGAGPGAAAARGPPDPRARPAAAARRWRAGDARYFSLLGLRLHLGRALRLDPGRGADRDRAGRRPCRAGAARAPQRRARRGAGAAVLLVVGAIGWERQDDYLDARYTNAEDFRFQLDDAAALGEGHLGRAHRRRRAQRRLQPVPLLRRRALESRPVHRPRAARRRLPHDRRAAPTSSTPSTTATTATS